MLQSLVYVDRSGPSGDRWPGVSLCRGLHFVWVLCRQGVRAVHGARAGFSWAGWGNILLLSE